MIYFGYAWLVWDTDGPFPGVNQNTDKPCYPRLPQNLQCVKLMHDHLCKEDIHKIRYNLPTTALVALPGPA